MTNLKTKIATENIDLKLENENEMTFSGYLAAFNNIDSYGDVILPGAFKACLRRQRKKGFYPPMLEQHGYGTEGRTPIGVWTRMEEDDFGLYVEGKLFSTTRGKDFYTILKESPANAIGMSIGYTIVKGTQNIVGGKSTGGMLLSELDLKEGSIVTFPANDAARVSNVKEEDERVVDGKFLTIRDLEKLLKEDYDLSSKKSKELISRLKDFDFFTFKSEDEQEFFGKKEPEELVTSPEPEVDKKEEDDSSKLREGLSDLFESLSKEEEELKKKKQIRDLVNEINAILFK